MKMIRLKLETPNPVTTTDLTTKLIVEPGKVGKWTFKVELDEDAPEMTVTMNTSTPGPAIIPTVNILPHLHFQSGYPKWYLDGEDFDQHGTFVLKPGEPRDVVIEVGLNETAPWLGEMYIDLGPQPAPQ